MKSMKKQLSRATSLFLSSVMLFGTMTTGVFAAENGASKNTSADKFAPKVTYQVTVTDAERAKIHAAVDNLSGYVGDMVVGDKSYDPNTLIGGLATGSSYNSISYGSKNAGSIPSQYPFTVPSIETNNNEGDRKTAKFAWVKELAENLGLEVVQRQDDKYVYVEIGDPDAPEMVMALSHLDSPTQSNNPEGNLKRWVNSKGELDPTAYYTPYVKDGWLYGAGVQDDSGPTLATLFAAKALMDSGVKFDRRIRIVMGAYEDSNPGVPSVEDTLKYMDIPYYTGNPGFYDNWCYKSLNREETPIAAYTSDSRFPVVVGNTRAWTPNIEADLSADSGKAFSLLTATAGVTLREGDDTLKDIVHGSTSQIASRAVFTLDVSKASEAEISAFIDSVKAAATARGWLPTAKGTFNWDGITDGQLGWAGVGQYHDQVNPCAFLLWMGAIANGGKAAEPYLIRKTVSSLGIPSLPHITQHTGQLIDSRTAATVADFMANNVTETYGTKRFPNMELCAKSGTAEVGTGQTPHAWFAGFLRNEDAPYAFVVLVENGGGGNAVAGTVAGKVLNVIVNGY